MINRYSNSKKASSNKESHNKSFLLEDPEIFKNSRIRVNKWIKKNIKTVAASILSSGISTMENTDQYQFRDYSPIGNIYIRKYLKNKNYINL